MTSGGYVGLSLGVLLSQHHQVVAVDIVQAKVDMINNKKSPIQDDYIEKYLAEKDLNLTATLDAKAAFRNSKYVQSRVGYAFQQVRNELKRGRMVCFSGTPCQIEGLRHFLGKDYQNLILVDVVCRAVPSPGVWEKYIQYEVEQKGKLSSIRFRDKSLGYQYSTMELRAENGKKYRGGIESQPWLRMFFFGNDY